MTIASTFEPFDREKVFRNIATRGMMFGEGLNDNPDLASYKHCAPSAARTVYRQTRGSALPQSTFAGEQRMEWNAQAGEKR